MYQAAFACELSDSTLYIKYLIKILGTPPLALSGQPLAALIISEFLMTLPCQQANGHMSPFTHDNTSNSIKIIENYMRHLLLANST